MRHYRSKDNQCLKIRRLRVFWWVCAPSPPTIAENAERHDGPQEFPANAKTSYRFRQWSTPQHCSNGEGCWAPKRNIEWWEKENYGDWLVLKFPREKFALCWTGSWCWIRCERQFLPGGGRGRWWAAEVELSEKRKDYGEIYLWTRLVIRSLSNQSWLASK